MLMNKIPLILILITLTLSTLAVAQDVVTDPVEDFASQYRDTSSIDHFNKMVLIKIVRDFNNDGINDIAVSETSEWGNAGGEWDIYLGQADGHYKYLDQMIFHADGIAFLPLCQGISEVVTYIHGGAEEGDLVHYYLSDKGVSKISGRRIVFNNPKDAEEYAKYNQLFGNAYKRPMSVCCRLSEYLRNKNCNWQPGYFIRETK
jgi:hypothetical protein